MICNIVTLIMELTSVLCPRQLIGRTNSELLMNRSRLRILTALPLLTVSFLVSQLIPEEGSENLRSLFESADLVCAGRVVELVPVGTITRHVGTVDLPFRIAQATIAAQRFYKPRSAVSTVRVTLYQPIPSPLVGATVLPSPKLSQNEYVLLFLKHVDSRLELSDKWFSIHEMSPLISQAQSSAGFDALEADLQAGLQDSDHVFDNLKLLSMFETVHSSEGIRRFADSSDIRVRGMALLALLKLGDYSHVQDSLEFMSLQGPPSMTEIQRLMKQPFNKFNDAKAIPVLLHFAGSPTLSVRQSVVKALRNVGDARCVPELVSRLDDVDFYIRYDALFALARIDGKLNPEWVPDLGGFKEHERRYLAKWKSWWVNEGAARYSGGSGVSSSRVDRSPRLP
jgi:hypothetical protein